MTIDQVFDLLAIDQEDRADCSRLLAGDVDQAAVAEATTALTRRLGSYREEPIGAATTDPMVWLTAFLQLTPVLVDWHRGMGVSYEITRATLADVGRNIAIHRKAHAAFGLETWDWLIPHYTGMLFALGRLNYMLHPTKESVGGAMSPGDWVPGIHIPESGPLTPEAVDASLVQAKAFFGAHFPDKPIAVAACVTWLLDPYLVRQMPATSTRTRTSSSRRSDGTPTSTSRTLPASTINALTRVPHRTASTPRRTLPASRGTAGAGARRSGDSPR